MPPVGQGVKWSACKALFFIVQTEKSMNIQLSDHFTYKKLFRFTLPSIAMMIFSSIYSVVDGFFVSNFAGKTPFAALNFIMPTLMILGAGGFMFGAGGSALVSKTLGEGDREKANRLFSLFIYFPFALSFLIAALGIVFLPQIADFLGAGALKEDCVRYGRIVLLGLPAVTLQTEFQTFFITAEKPQFGFYMTVAAGVTNIVLDALLVGLLPRLLSLSLDSPWRLVGAAAATVFSQCVGGFVPLFYFFRKNKSLLRLGKTSFYGAELRKGTSNGFSELLNGISMSLVGILFNYQLMKYAGENGVAAYGVIMYVDFVFVAVFLGYATGTAPVIGFHYGAENTDELKNLLKKSLILMGGAGVCMFGIAEALAVPLARLFAGYDAALLEMTIHGFRYYSFAFLIAGISIFGSSFFTALNNGAVSAAISFLRTAVFEVASILVLPVFFGIDGVWYAVIVSRALSLAVTLSFLAVFRKRYQYW